MSRGRGRLVVAAGWLVALSLAAIRAWRADACVAVEAMVAEMTGAPAVQRCERDADPPRCVIEISAAAG